MKFSDRAQESVAAMRKWLADANLARGARIPSERQIARELQTTQYAINRAAARLVAEGIIQREGYKLFYTPQNVRPSNTFVFLGREGTELIKAAKRVVSAKQINLQILTWESHEDFFMRLQRLCSAPTSGLVFVTPFSADTSLGKAATGILIGAGIPFIYLGPATSGVTSLIQDFAAAADLAFKHLFETGHTELALITFGERTSSVQRVLELWDRNCRGNGLLTSIDRIYHGRQTAHREVARQIAKKLTEEWRNVTGLVVHHRELAPFLAEELANRQRRLPDEISMICVGDHAKLKTSIPPVDCAGFDDVFLLQLAFRLLQWTIEEKATHGKFPKSQCVLIKPELILRGSTTSGKRPLAGTAGDSEQPPSGHSVVGRWPDDLLQLRDRIETIVRRPYALTQRVADSRFRPVDLSTHLNRPLNIRRGWLGDGSLPSMHAGEHRIHGIPFQIQGGSTSPAPGAIVFRSLKNSKGLGMELPEKARIHIGCKARAIYILHGCNYTEYMKQFAVYRFHSKSGVIGSVPLISLGMCPPHTTSEEWQASIAKANIQDWWPDYFQTDFEHAGRVIVVQDAETMQGHRYLYTLEWKNPEPDRKIEYVEVWADSNSSTTLGLLGVTVLSE